jgi:hypothetical protein
MWQIRSDRGIHWVRVPAVAISLVLTLPLQTLPLYAQMPAPGPANQATSQANQQYSAEQLDSLLAPVALYPDVLLTQVLMAATQPLEVIEAARWVAIPTNTHLTGDALTAALASQNWDPSVKSLVPFPTVLDMLNEHPDWTQQLGLAFASQQADVLESVQRLRQQAQAAGHLQSNDQLVVATQTNAITIEPANPQLVYVPYYDPQVVYGSWRYAGSPPVYFAPPVRYGIGAGLATGLAFGAGIAITAGLWNLARPNWGWRGAGYGGVNVNVNNWNRVNVNRPALNEGGWRPGPAGRPGGPIVGPGRPGVGVGGGRPGGGGVPLVAHTGVPLTGRPGSGGGGGGHPSGGGGGGGHPGGGGGGGGHTGSGGGGGHPGGGGGHPGSGGGGGGHPSGGGGGGGHPGGGGGGHPGGGGGGKGGDKHH